MVFFGFICSSHLLEESDSYIENSVSLGATLFRPDENGKVVKDGSGPEVTTTITLPYLHNRDVYDTSGMYSQGRNVMRVQLNWTLLSFSYVCLLLMYS